MCETLAENSARSPACHRRADRTQRSRKDHLLSGPSRTRRLSLRQRRRVRTRTSAGSAPTTQRSYGTDGRIAFISLRILPMGSTIPVRRSRPTAPWCLRWSYSEDFSSNASRMRRIITSAWTNANPSEGSTLIRSRTFGCPANRGSQIPPSGTPAMMALPRHHAPAGPTTLRARLMACPSRAFRVSRS